jgi:hypothetical protein
MMRTIAVDLQPPSTETGFKPDGVVSSDDFRLLVTLTSAIAGTGGPGNDQDPQQDPDKKPKYKPCLLCIAIKIIITAGAAGVLGGDTHRGDTPPEVTQPGPGTLGGPGTGTGSKLALAA